MFTDIQKNKLGIAIGIAGAAYYFVKLGVLHMSWQNMVVFSALAFVLFASIFKLVRDKYKISERLLAQEERFKLAIEGANCGLWDWDVPTNKVFFSPLWKSMLGYQDHEIDGSFDVWKNLIHPDDLARALSTIQSYFEGKSTHYFLEHRLRTKTGEYRWILAQGACRRDKDGKIAKMVGWHIDMQPMREREREISEQQKMFSMITSHIGDVIWLTDLSKNKMAYVSPSYEAVWERSCSSLYENPLSFVSAIHSLDRQRVIESLSKQIKNSYDEIYRIDVPSGKIKWIRDRSFTVKDPDGEVRYVVGIASDITNEKNQEKIISDQQIRLVSTFKLTALGEMAGGLAHEINNPLAIIMAKIQQLLERADEGVIAPADLKKALLGIESTSQRIMKIVKGLRAIYRNEEQDPMEEVAIRLLLDDVFELCREKFLSSDIRLSAYVETDGFLNCRPAQIGQVLLNLLNNAYDAVKGVPNSWVEVRVREEGAMVNIEICDSGAGVPKEIASKIMHPFFTTKKSGQGTGLGLSISQAIVSDHGGKIFLDSSSPHTKFVIQIPSKKIV